MKDKANCSQSEHCNGFFILECYLIGSVPYYKKFLRIKMVMLPIKVTIDPLVFSLLYQNYLRNFMQNKLINICIITFLNTFAGLEED